LALATALTADTAVALATVENIREVPPMASFISGPVEQSTDGGTTWATLDPQFRLDRHSLVRTGADGACVLVFEDDSVLALKEATTIELLPEARELRLRVLAGEAWVRFYYVVENERNGVSCGQASFLALGAGDFSFQVTKSTSVATVLEGTGAVVPAGGGDGAELAAGQSVTAGENGLLPSALIDVAAEKSEWDPLLREAGVSTTMTTLATTTTVPLPPDQPEKVSWTGVVVFLVLLVWGALTVIAIVGTLIYVAINRWRRTRRYDPGPS
jgi:ferric-dicitrate binding protein FerR (iron transport regulator)